MVSFKGAHFQRDIILTCVRWYVAYPLSYRHLEEMMQERGVSVDHATINRWVLKYTPQLQEAFHRHKRPVWVSWRMDETYIKIKGQWYYLYRAVDKTGQTIDFLLTEHRDERAATRFLTKAIRRHGIPEKITIDGSEANAAVIRGYNEAHGTAIIIRQVKYPNNVVEIVCTPLTTTHVLTPRMRRSHRADVDVFLGDADAVDQQLDQTPPLHERGVGEARLHPLTKSGDRTRQPCHRGLAIHLGLAWGQLCVQRLDVLFQGPAPSLILLPREALGSVRRRQPIHLGLQLDPPFPQRLLTRLQLLGKPVTTMGSLQRIRKVLRLPHQRPEVLPHQVFSWLGRDVAGAPWLSGLPIAGPRRRPTHIIAQPPLVVRARPQAWHTPQLTRARRS
jgi:putative transposase